MLALGLASTPAAAQVVIPPDTVPAAGSDSTPGARAADSTPSPGPVADSAVSPGPTPPAARPPAPAAAEPVDSALAAACGGGGSLAEGLLVVSFRAGATLETAAATAKAVGATLAGPAAGGGVYFKVPATAGLNALADRVILQDAVESVGPAECPAAPAAAAPADTAGG